MSDPGAVPAGSFAVDLPVFTGPFRLLAELIMEQKVDVCDIAVATVTDGYLAYAKESGAWNLEEATWFLAICAVLLELKVGRLMPRHTEQNEEDLLGASPDLAYARSIELAAFRRVAVELARRLEDEAGFFARDVGPGPEFSHLYPDPMETIVAEDLARAAAQLLRPPPTLDLELNGRSFGRDRCLARRRGGRHWPAAGWQGADRLTTVQTLRRGRRRATDRTPC